MFSRLRNFISPSKREEFIFYLHKFESTKDSYFKEWFNENHMDRKLKSKLDYHKFGFDFMINWLSSYELLKTSHQVKEDRQKMDIISFEIGCWYLSLITVWLMEKDHKNSVDIAMMLTNNFTSLAKEAFQLELSDLYDPIEVRTDAYGELGSMDSQIQQINNQVAAGLEQGCVATSLIPNSDIEFNLSTQYEGTFIRRYVKESVPYLVNSWEKIYLNRLSNS